MLSCLVFFKDLYQVYKTVKNVYKFFWVFCWAVFGSNEISAVKAKFEAEG